jgi:hypothetical protein
MAPHQFAEDDNKISNEFVSAPRQSSVATKPSVAPYWLGGIASLAIIVFGVWVTIRSNPRESERITAERAIEQCWAEQQRPSFSAEGEQFLAAACEKLESDYRAKYSRKP